MTTANATISRLDRERLLPLIPPAASITPSWPLAQLRRLLEKGRVVRPQKMPANVVTMNSRVRLRDPMWETVETLTLVYPKDAGEEPGTVSVTSPLGAALLGTRVGGEARWIGPRGPRRVVVEEIEYQPERAGDFER